jgi:hypothetical protein
MPRLGLYLTDEEYRLIHNTAQAERRSMNAWCIMALISQIKGVKQVTSTIPQGHDLIDQKRAADGRFVKRT